MAETSKFARSGVDALGPKPSTTEASVVEPTSALRQLQFDNVILRELPLDKETKNFVRPVRGAYFSRVLPTVLEKPRLVAAR